MYADFYERYDDLLNNRIEEEMERVKEKAIKKFQSLALFKTQEYLDAFIKMFCFCWQESLPLVEILAEELDFCKMDFLALAEDFDGFKEEFLEDMEKWRFFDEIY